MTDTAAVKAGVVLEIGGMRHPVNPPGITIGRGSAADLKIDDPGISRQHAEIRVTHQGLVPHVTVSDLGSTNGIVLNGHRVDSAEVPDGSEIKLGNTLMKVHIVTGSTEGPADERTHFTLIKVGFLAVLWLFVLSAGRAPYQHPAHYCDRRHPASRNAPSKASKPRR